MASDSGPNKPLIRANTGVQDALLHNPSQSPFAYQAPMTCANFIAEQVIFRPLNFNGMAGQKVQFSLTKQADLVGPINLVTVFKPLTQPSAPYAGNVTRLRYINNLGIGQIDSARILYGSNVICHCLPEWLYIRYRKYLNTEAAHAWRVLSKMDQTLSERNAFALAGGEVITNLCVPWGDDTSQYFSMCGMADALRIEVNFKPLKHLLNYDVTNNLDADQQLFGSDTPAIYQDINLLAECVHLTGAERDIVVANIKSPNGQPKLVEDIQAHIRVLIPAQASAFTYRLKLTNITGPVTSIFWYLEDPLNTQGTQKDTKYGGDYPHYPEPGLNKQWDYYYMVSGGNTIIPRTSSLRSRFHNHVKWFSGAHPGEYINPYSFSTAPEITNASYGTLNFGQLDYPELIISFPNGLLNNYDPLHPGTSQGAYLNVVADTRNFYHEQGGDFTKTFY